jgi:hypothetical protein
MNKTWSTFGMIFLAAFSVQAGDNGKDKPATKSPVTAKMVANKTTFELDLGGMTPDQYKEALKNPDPRKLPPLPKVDMALELTNTSDKDVQVWIGGTPVKMMLDLKGPGAIKVTPRQFFPAIFIMPKPVTLAPGKSHLLPMATLSFGHRGLEHRAYWTGPGEYSLQASLITGLNPPPKGVQPDRMGFGKTTITSEPIKIKVQTKE